MVPGDSAGCATCTRDR